MPRKGEACKLKQVRVYEEAMEERYGGRRLGSKGRAMRMLSLVRGGPEIPIHDIGPMKPIVYMTKFQKGRTQEQKKLY